MSLSPGTRIGPYDIVDILGAGGMGEVYRARDKRLNRDVAIKLLPDGLVGDPERIVRFEREARTLASLNHPHIAALYGLEEIASERGLTTRALVMELVEGPTLADRLMAGPLPIDEVVAVARQIAAALEAAHQLGIVHRDLKPANIKVTPSGTVKVLDFGLAKATDPAQNSQGAGQSDLSRSPTITSPALTERGVILGTAAYMAPEQARGRAVDKRADIWAFGAVLYEMLTGQRAFGGDDLSDTLANVLRGEPSFDNVPVRWRPLLRRCLAKEPKQRLRDIGDAALELEELTAPDGRDERVGNVSGRQTRNWQFIAGALALATGSFAFFLWRSPSVAPASATPAVMRFNVTMPPDANLVTSGPSVAMSPDGQAIVYVADRAGVVGLFRHDLVDGTSRPIDGSANGRAAYFSPDGRSLIVVGAAANSLGTLPARGGVLQPVCPSGPGGAAWLADASIVFGRGSLFRTPVATCTPETITTNETPLTIGHRWPAVLHGTNVLAYTVVNVSQGVPKLMAMNVTDHQPREVGEGTFSRFAPPDWLLFARRRQDNGTGQLLAARFDPDGLRFRDQPTVLVDGVGIESNGAAHFAVSRTGALVYAPTSAPVVRIVNVDGRATQGIPIGPQADMIAVSPDGRRAVVTLESRLEVVDLDRGLSERVAFEPGQYKFPVWLPGGRQVSYRFQAAGESRYQVIVLDLASGKRESVMIVEADTEAGGVSTWSVDGRTMFGNAVGPRRDHDLFKAVRGGSSGPEPVIATPVAEFNARLSPDGRLLAFVAYNQGAPDVYVQPVGGGERTRVSTTAATDPNWAPDGGALFFRDGSRIFKAAVSAGPAGISVGSPVLVAERPLSGRLWSYGVTPDGRLVTLERAQPANTLHVVLNWPTLLTTDRQPGQGQ